MRNSIKPRWLPTYNKTVMRYILWLCFLPLFSIHVQAQSMVPTADEVLKAAFEQASAGQKNVMVIFTASWCGWCRKMDLSLNDSACRKTFDNNYIIIHLTVFENGIKEKLENKGAEELLRKYSTAETGIPFWVIYDKDGSLLGDSFMRRPGGRKTNIGCPASKAEVAAFVHILKTTSSATDKELEIVSTVFRKNDSRK